MLNNYVFLLFNLKLLQIYLYKCEKKVFLLLVKHKPLKQWRTTWSADE